MALRDITVKMRLLASHLLATPELVNQLVSRLVGQSVSQPIAWSFIYLIGGSVKFRKSEVLEVNHLLVILLEQLSLQSLYEELA